jgi:hypothetical protein
MRRAAIGALLAAAMCGCGTRSNVTSATVYAAQGQTLKEMIDSLPLSGGVVVLGPGTWLSGYHGHVHVEAERHNSGIRHARL